MGRHVVMPRHFADALWKRAIARYCLQWPDSAHELMPFAAVDDALLRQRDALLVRRVKAMVSEDRRFSLEDKARTIGALATWGDAWL